MAAPPPAARRPDISDAVVHFTRERVRVEFPETVTEATAFEVVKEIVTGGRIRAGSGFVKGTQKVVCFSETPLSAVLHLASPPSEPSARYRCYGVVLSKRSAFVAGARPVIYLPDAEATWLPVEQRWRHVRFEHPKIDHTNEREWRALGDVDLTQVPGMYLLTWSSEEAQELTNLASPIKHLVRGVLPIGHLAQFL
jgi:hypothetical protein